MYSIIYSKLAVLLLERNLSIRILDPLCILNGIGTKVKFGRASAEACWNGSWDKKSWYWPANVSLWKLQQVYQCHWHNQKVPSPFFSIWVSDSSTHSIYGWQFGICTVHQLFIFAEVAIFFCFIISVLQVVLF